MDASFGDPVPAHEELVLVGVAWPGPSFYDRLYRVLLVLLLVAIYFIQLNHGVFAFTTRRILARELAGDLAGIGRGTAHHVVDQNG